MTSARFQYLIFSQKQQVAKGLAWAGAPFSALDVLLFFETFIQKLTSCVCMIARMVSELSVRDVGYAA